MKVEQVKVPPVFEPITITIESVEELKWLLAIANSSESEARQQAMSLGFNLPKGCVAQMALWNGVSKYMELCNE